MKASRRARLRGLYAITPACSDTGTLVERVRACLAGGATLLQYRAKAIDPALARTQAEALARECKHAGALFIVNDSLELAMACGADGVHLGRDDLAIAAARARWPQGIVGASCYDEAERAIDARGAGADYVAVGSLFASATKPLAKRAPLETIARARELGGLPVAAIGGIDASNAALAIGAGADMVAAISALFDAPDPRTAAAAISRLFRTHEDSPHARAQPRAV